MSEDIRWQRLSEAMREIGGLAASRHQIDSFKLYLQQIITWSRAQRLTGFGTPEAIVEQLFIDSLRFLPLIPARPCRLLDVGSGVGAPGIPLRIAEPRLSLTLVEAKRKRVSFLHSALRALDLRDVQVLHGRAEELVGSRPELASFYDAAVMRSVGRPEAVVPLVKAYLKPWGLCIISGPPGDSRLPPTPQVPGFTSNLAHSKLACIDVPRTFLVFVKIP